MYEIYIPTGYWNKDNTFNLYFVEHSILQILEADPNASICLKLKIDTPTWWINKYPKETFFSNKGRRGPQSFCSEQWRKDAISAICKLVESLEKRPVGKAVAGVLVLAFKGGEFQLWGEDVGEYDCSPVAQKIFASWQKKNNISPGIELPNPALEWPFKKGTGYNRIRRIFFSFVAETQAENIIWFTREFKKRFGSKYAFGAYYGYVMEHAGNIRRLLFSGHLGIEKVLNESQMDMISCPTSYSLRKMHQSHAFMFPVDSALMHKIAPIIENDTRNYLTQYFGDVSGKTIPTLDDSIKSNLKLRILAASHGATVRYLALLQIVDFFASLPIIRSIKTNNSLVMTLKPALLGCDDQVAMVVNPMTWVSVSELNDGDQITGVFISKMRDILMRTGRSVAYITTSDWLKNTEKWDYVVIPLPGLQGKKSLSSFSKVFGKLPKISLNDGALILTKKGCFVSSSPEEIRKRLSILSAVHKPNTIWYIGDNFTATWQSNKLDLKLKK